MSKSKLEDKYIRVSQNAMKYLNGVGDNHINDPNYIPESVQPYINKFIREGRKTFDFLTSNIDKFDKSSDEYVAMQREMENVAKTFVQVRNQVDKYKQGISDFKNALGNMNAGTQDSKYFTAASIFGNQPDSVEIDGFGNISFGVEIEKGKGGMFKLDDVADISSGGPTSIVTEPFGSKTFVWKLAEKTKADKDNGKTFDPEWTYKKVLNNFADFGPLNSIGMAFTNMAGDNSSKSFAEMYEEGLKDPKFYIHPETGESLPKDSIWMKDENNADIVSKLMAKYITNIMGDLHYAGAPTSSMSNTNTPTANMSAEEKLNYYRNLSK